MATPAQTETIVITGASDGIGAAAARALAGPDVNMVLVGRSPDKTAAIAEETGAVPLTADFAELDDVHELAGQISEKVDRIDVLVNNAGGTFDPKTPTADGHEPNFQINHLAPFLLTNLLREHLAAADGARVINTSSLGNRWGRVDLDDLDYRRRRVTSLQAYGTSKLMNILFTRGIAQRWLDDGTVSAAVHPGVVATSFGRESFLVDLGYRTPVKRLFTITPEQGADPLVKLARRDADPAFNGVYFHRHRPHGTESSQASDPKLIDGLWAASAALTGVAG
ncbi:SDR family NAD(P)-dependent oxidoreductase [Gordonia iterans]